MINHIAYLNSFKDKNSIPGNLFFNKFIFRYEKDKLLDIVCKENNSHLFFISDTFLEFKSLFFKMGIIYKIFKKYGFDAKVEINENTYLIKTFSDYYDVFEKCSESYITIFFAERKFNFTFIDPYYGQSYIDLLSDFYKFNNIGFQINYIYSLNEKKESFYKIINFHKNLNNLGNKKKVDSILTKIDNSIDNCSLKKLPPIDKSIVKFPIIKNIKIIKQPLPPSKKIADTKTSKYSHQLPPTLEKNLFKPSSNNTKTDSNKDNGLKIIDEMVSILSLLDQTKNSSISFETILEEIDNKKLLEINTNIHKKVINNFYKLKLNKDKKDKKVNQNIIKETINLLNECLTQLSTLI